VHFLDFRDSQAAVIRTDSEIIVTFRGTSSIFDWLTNAQAYRVQARHGGSVHFGFNQYVSRVGASVYHALVGLRDRDQRVLVTGHSLGGVASTIWCNTWLRDGNSRKFPMEHITFGSPKPGDAEFADSFDEVFGDISIRVTNGADLVPHIPTAFPYWLDLAISTVCRANKFPIIPGKYRHAQKNHLHFDTCGRIRINPSKTEQWKDFLAALWADFGIKGLAGIKAHDMSRQYERKIERLP
jgi:hypothetical protein